MQLSINSKDYLKSCIQEGSSVRIIRELKKAGFNLNSILDHNGNTAIHLCIIHKRSRLFNELLKHNVSLVERNYKGKTPLHICAEYDQVNFAKLLLQRGVSVELEDLEGRTSLFYAKSSTFINLLKNNNVNIMFLDRKKRTALHYAENKAVCRVLLRYGTELTHTDEDGNQPIHLVKNPEVLDVLLNHFKKLYPKESGVNIRNSNNRTPLHTALSEGRHDVAKALIHKGADAKALDSQGFSPVEALFEYQEYDTRIGSYSSDKEKGYFTGHPISNVHLRSAMLIHEAYPNYQDKNGNTLIHFAAKSGSSLVIFQFIERMHDKNLYDYDQKNNDGLTPLHFAAKCGQTSTLAYLLNLGANIDNTDKDGKQALHLAVENGHIETMECLLSYGAMLEWEDKYNKTPLGYAISEDCQKLLLDNGAKVRSQLKLDKNLEKEALENDRRAYWTRLFPPYPIVNGQAAKGPLRQMNLLIHNNPQGLNNLILNKLIELGHNLPGNAKFEWELLPIKKNIWGETLLKHLNYKNDDVLRRFTRRWPNEFDCILNNTADVRPTWNAIGKIIATDGTIEGLVLLISVGEEKHIIRPAPKLARTNRLLIKATMNKLGYCLNPRSRRYYSQSEDSIFYNDVFRYLEPEVVASLISETIALPVYPIILYFFDDETIPHSGVRAEGKMKSTLREVEKEANSFRGKDQIVKSPIISVWQKADDPPNWREHKVCYLNGQNVCYEYKLANLSLVEPSNNFLEQYRSVKTYEFNVGHKMIEAVSNIFTIPENHYNVISTRVVLDKGSCFIQYQMQQTIYRIEKKYYSTRYGNYISDFEDMIINLKKITKYIVKHNNSLEVLVDLLKEWDETIFKLAKIFKRLELFPLPGLSYIRNGFFLQNSITDSIGRIQAGCYVKQSEEDIKKTVIHELAHAAMALNREANAVAGCRWLEEGFAEFFAQKDRDFMKTILSSSEGDVYIVWTALADMFKNGQENEVENILEKWLNPNIPTNLCPIVLKLREDSRRYYYQNTYPS